MFIKFLFLPLAFTSILPFSSNFDVFIIGTFFSALKHTQVSSTKARGIKFGREKKEVTEEFDEWYLRWRRREITGNDMCDRFGMHISTIYQKARERGLPFTPMNGKGYPYKRTEAKNTPSV